MQTAPPQLVVVGSHAPGIQVRVKRIPTAGETVIGWDLEEVKDGGKGSNQAIAAARLGLAVSFVGCLGRDRLGAECEKMLVEEGVDISCLYRSDSEATGAGLIILDENGIPAMVSTLGANAELSIQQVEAALAELRTARILLTQFEIRPEVALHAARVARDYGMIAIVNPAPASPVSLPDLAAADILTPNEGEAKSLLGMDPATPADLEGVAQDLLFATGAGVVIITAGEQGIIGADASGVWRSAASPVAVVDTSGAGDVYCAALAAALLRGLHPRAASVWACTPAALSVTRAGTIPTFPTLAEVEAFAQGLSTLREQEK